MSIYEGTQTERDFRAGIDDGRRWAEQDANEGSRTFWLENFRAECETFRDMRSPSSPRAYYVGVLRGYREVMRILRNGRWST